MPPGTLTTDERFDAKWIEDPETGCHVWTATRNARGYGRFAIRGRPWRWMLAHRYAYEREYGSIPDGHHLHHRCSTPACVNPAHLQAVTPNAHPDAGPMMHSSKTHCLRGHPFDEENTYWRRTASGGMGRNCRACHREYERRRRAKVAA